MNFQSLAVTGKATPKIAVVYYSELKPMNESFKTNFSPGAISLNKCQLLQDNNAHWEV